MGIETGIDLDALIGVRAARAGDRRPRAAERAAARRARAPTVHVVSEPPTSPNGSREHAERALAGQPREGRATSSPRRTSCSCATGSRCCSTTARSSRTGCSRTRSPAICPADGVVTGVGRVDGRPVCVMANDPTVKAGSWGARTVEKIVRLTEHALRHELPVVYLVDSAGARITDQVELFPGRRGAGRIFANQVRLSGKVPQVCCLFGPSAAGGAYIPAFCDVVFMVEGNASMYLGSPRMAEVVIGEQVSLEEMGGARMHATVSGCGDNLVRVRRGRDRRGAALPVVPADVVARSRRRSTARVAPVAGAQADRATIVPAEERRAYDMHKVIDALVDDGLVLRAEAAVGARS